MEAAPEPTAFAVEMERRRNILGLSVNKAALRCNISPSRWGQLARGYVKQGDHYQPAAPELTLAIKIADGLGWPRSEALPLAGFDPGAAVDTPPEMPPTRIMSIWNQLTPQQRDCWEWNGRLMLDPHAAYGGKPPATGNRPVFVPPAGKSWSDAQSKKS